MNKLGYRRLVIGAVLLVSSTFAIAQPTDKIQYFFVLLKRPAHPPELSTEDREKLQEAHMSNIRKLHAEHKLFVAGPFMDDDPSLRGIFVFQGESRAQVEEWVKTDPMVRAGRLSFEVYGPWLINPDLISNPGETAQGLEQYTLVLLKGGSEWTAADHELIRRHAEFLNDKIASGEVVLAGMFSSPAQNGILGVVIFRDPVEETSRLIQSDPAIRSSLLQSESHAWATGKGVLKPGMPLQ